MTVLVVPEIGVIGVVTTVVVVACGELVERTWDGAWGGAGVGGGSRRAIPCLVVVALYDWYLLLWVVSCDSCGHNTAFGQFGALL